MFVVNSESKGYSGLPHWEISESDSLNLASGGKWFPGMRRISTHTVWEPLQGLHLNNFIQIESERRLDGQTIESRCQSMASVLGVPATDLTKYVKSWLSKLPSSDVNRAIDREDVEQGIYRKLLANKGQLTGDWELTKACVKAGYIDWYRNWKRSKNVDHLQAINLTRESFLEDSKNGTHDVPDVVDMTAPIEFKANFRALLESLPKPIAKIVLMRFMGTPQSPEERQRWHRFITNPKNYQTMLGVLNGSRTGKVKWEYKGERGRPPKARPENGLVIIVTPGRR